MGADDHNNHEDRHAKKHTGDAPNHTPERKREYDCKGTHIQALAHQHRLKHAANRDLNQSEAGNQKKKRSEGFKLHQRQQAGERNSYDRANVGYIIEYKN